MSRIHFSKKQIRQFEKMGIEIIYLFGSRVQGFVSLLSDFDFGIVFEKPEKYKKETMDVYLKLYDIFTDVLPKNYLRKRFEMRAHEFDIVFLQFTPISLQFEAIKNSKVLYEKNKKRRLNYEEYVTKKQCDLKYFHDLRYKAILERI